MIDFNFTDREELYHNLEVNESLNTKLVKCEGFSYYLIENFLKRPKKAIETFKFSIKLNPNNSEVYNNLGNVYKELFLYDKANNCYKQAIKLNKNYAGAYNNLGIVLHAQLKFKEAEINYSKAFSF